MVGNLDGRVTLLAAPENELRGCLTRAFEEVGQGNVALTGGSTARFFLSALLAALVDWSRVTLFWGDERAVAADDPESNFGLAERLLLRPLGGRAPRAFRMRGELSDLEAAAAEYDATLARELGEDGVLDLAILGVGPDGHICSLFRGHPALSKNGSRVVAVEQAPKPPDRRLSLTLSFLARSRQVWGVAIGAEKRDVLERAMTRHQQSREVMTPLEILLETAQNVSIFTDQVIERSAATFSI